MVVRYSSSEMCGSLIRVGESARPITKQMAKAPDAADADGTLEHITVEHNREVARAPRERAASQPRSLADFGRGLPGESSDPRVEDVADDVASR